MIVTTGGQRSDVDTNDGVLLLSNSGVRSTICIKLGFDEFFSDFGDFFKPLH